MAKRTQTEENNKFYNIWNDSSQNTTTEDLQSMSYMQTTNSST